MRVPPLAAGVAVLLVLGLAASASAGPRGKWTRLPGTVINFAEPGLARTSDGVLHVLYVRQTGPRRDLMHTPVRPTGAVGRATVALRSFRTMNHPKALRMRDDTLRVFFGGIRSTTPGEQNTALNTATAPARGAPWTLQEGKAAQSNNAYTGAATGAGLTRDGTPISAFSASGGLGFHYGVDPADPDGLIPQTGCCLYYPDIGVDAGTGQAYIGFFSLEQRGGPGIFVNAIGANGPQGGRMLAPGSVTGRNSRQPGNRTPITGRIEAPGVFMVYGQGYPTARTLAVWRVGRAKPQLVFTADRIQHVNVATAPEGRLWLFGEQSGAINVWRTNTAVTKVGPVTKLTPPRKGAVFKLNGEGSAGPLDLVANVQAGGQSFWHQQVWPKLQLVASTRAAGAGRTITFRVLDAGDPVPGAAVKVGGRTLRTAANGTVALRQGRPTPVRATASRAGFVAASINVR